LNLAPIETITMSFDPAHHLNLGTVLGVHGDAGQPAAAPLLVMPGESRDKHLYVVGATGAGKSMFLEGLLRQDILNQRRSGSAIVLLDPHGSLYDGIVRWLARLRLDRRVVPIDLRQHEWIVAYNAIRRRQDSSASVVVDAFVRTMAHAWGAAGVDQTPLLARWITNLIAVLYEKGLTLPQAFHLLCDNEIRANLTCQVADPWVSRDWTMAAGLNSRDFEQQVSSTVNRLRRFVGADQFQLMLGQPTVSLDLHRALDEGWIILISLATEGGKVSRQNADLFGSMFLTDLWTAAQERGKRKDLRPCRIYVDEFQSFISPTIAENLDQSRGFGLSWTMAHQFPMQLLDRGEYGKQLWHSVVENASSKVVFRMSHEENLRPLAQWLFTGTFNPDEIKHILYSTKVMGYREEVRQSFTNGTARSEGRSSSNGYSRSDSSSSGASSSIGGGDSYPREQGVFNDRQDHRLSESFADNESWSSSTSETQTSSESESQSQSESNSVTSSTMLIPQMGREISHVQFRSLEEQLFRSMAALFSQPPRHAVVRLLGMRAPVTIQTLPIPPQFVRPGCVAAYLARQYAKWDFCMLRQQAMRAVAERDNRFLQSFAIEQLRAAEPKPAGRRLGRRKT